MKAKMRHESVTGVVIGLLILLLLLLVTGCDDEDDCVTCVQAPPVAPTQVYSVSGDGQITVFWNDYPEIYDDSVVGYRIWSRYFTEGDQNDPAREFYLMDEVAVGQNYNADTGQYYYVDTDVVNGVGHEDADGYEYAVSAFSDYGESYLSFEFVVDTPLPMSETPLTLFDVAGPSARLSGFDFSLASEHGGGSNNGSEGIVDPRVVGTTADIQVRFDENGVPWLETLRGDVHVQDSGTFLDADGGLYFEGVSWAPEFGWSSGGVLELIRGHIYVVEIYDELVDDDIHYAKLGITNIDAAAGTVRIMWAYQLINGLPELSPPEARGGDQDDIQAIRL